jgi:hypothetical protein
MKEQKYKLVEKAYCIDLIRIKHGYEYSLVVCHAKNLNAAKSIIYKLIKNEGMENCYDEPISLANIPVIRYENSDHYFFENKIMTLREINGTVKERLRIAKLERLLNDESIKFCHICKHGSYYRPNSAGYTDYLSRAGVYEKKEAIEHARRCDELSLIPINIETHNKLIYDEIKDLQLLLISE